MKEFVVKINGKEYKEGDKEIKVTRKNIKVKPVNTENK